MSYNMSDIFDQTTEIPSRQEMYSRAVRGLAGQGWKPSYISGTMGLTCMYRTENDHRCAWGHVDPKGTGHSGIGNTTVIGLAGQSIGLAARLTPDDLVFARRLQCAHDDPFTDGPVSTEKDEPAILFRAMREFGNREGLDWPADVSTTEPS